MYTLTHPKRVLYLSSLTVAASEPVGKPLHPRPALSNQKRLLPAFKLKWLGECPRVPSYLIAFYPRGMPLNAPEMTKSTSVVRTQADLLRRYRTVFTSASSCLLGLVK